MAQLRKHLPLAAVALVVATATIACSDQESAEDSDSSRGATAAAAASASAPARMSELPIPFEDSGACPFEGCSYRMWKTTRAVDLRATRGDTAVAFRLPANTWVRGVTGVVVTTVPGVVRFHSSTDVEAYHDTLHATPDDTVFVLRPEGEGYVTAWFKGKLRRGVDGGFFGGACAPGRTCGGYVVSEPKTTWWVNVRDSTGRSGWTNDTRAFTCMDRLGGDRECDSHQNP